MMGSYENSESRERQRTMLRTAMGPKIAAALAEQVALQSVKARAVEIAIRAATDLVAETIDKDGAATLVDKAIDNLPQRAA